MKNLYRQYKLKAVGATAVFILLFITQAFAQQTIEGIVRIKVSEGLASQVERKKITKDLSGDVITGVAVLDQRNKQFKVKSFTRVFPDAGKNEMKHRRYGLHLWYEVRADKSIPLSSILQSYRSEQQILQVEPVYKKALIGSASDHFGPRLVNGMKRVVPAALPNASNDPLLASQWHYNNTGQTGGTPGADISLLDAWKIETGQKDVVVAVTDGGVQTNHIDLRANMWRNPGEVPGNKIDDDSNGYVDDINGYSFVQQTGKISADDHGTHVAGTIAAVTNNGIGVAGVAGGSSNGDGVRLMSCAVFQDDSLPDGFAEAYVYSADNGAVISQNSWGYLLPNVFEQVVLEAIDYFIAEAGRDADGNQIGPMAGGLVIFSAGNDNNDQHYYPAYYEPVLAVASSTHRDKKAQYSNYGTWIDITAPGGETYQNTKEGVVSTLPGNQYGHFMGTSMACPHVSGVAGLVLSKFGSPGFNSNALRERLLRSVDNIDGLNPTYAGKLGTGRINAARALSQSDPAPPNRITNLSVKSKDIGEITLTWTSPKDDNDLVVSYDLRYSTSPITTANFESANQVPNPPVPQPPGTRETFTVRNLPGGVVFYFAIRSADFEGNLSPISNVVKETSALAPSIAVVPAAIKENLKTAARSTRTFTIRNAGQGPLEFSISEVLEDEDFASVSPQQGKISPGKILTITVSFDAAGLISGTYQQKLIIESNDPLKGKVTLPLTLIVTNNGAPIASWSPQAIDFKSVQNGTSVSFPVTISNDGSEQLIVTKIISNNPAFTAKFSGAISVPPFGETELLIYFSPTSTGPASGVILISTNDPANPILNVTVKGEGLKEPPIVIVPNRFDETLAQGTSITRKMVLRNNGSEDRSFRVQVKNNRLAGDLVSANARNSAGRVANSADTASQRVARMREKHAAGLSEKSEEEKQLLMPVGPRLTQKDPDSGQGRRSQNATWETKQYNTGFEEFSLGTIGEQQGWYTTDDWMISAENPDRGAQHMRGNSNVWNTGEKLALSPFIIEDGEYYPRYTTTTMRLNLDNAKGTSWQVVPQDPWTFIATRIRFNANGTIDALVVDDDYVSHWKRVPVKVPSGYFDLTIEYDSWGTETNPFPAYLLFINNRHVFSGTGLGSGIGQVAFVSPTKTPNPVFEVDELKIFADEYIPTFIEPDPREGIIPAGQTIDVNLEFDATYLKFGTYYSDVVVYLDERDSLVAPATLSVTGEPSIFSDTYAIRLETNKGERDKETMVLANTGGRPVQYNLDLQNAIPGVTISPRQGVIPVRGRAYVNVEFQGQPGLYESQILLKTDIEDYPVQQTWLEVVAFDSGAVFNARSRIQFTILSGEISTRKVKITNDGINTVSFIADTTYLPAWFSIYPATATISDLPVGVNFTFDARELSPGLQRTSVNFKTNDVNKPEHRMLVTVNVLPDTVRGGKILREVWSGIPGKNISSIPLTGEPDSTGFLTSFESPANTADNYGSRIRGYVQAPASGYYTFWISGNDNSELWLSSDESQGNKKKIASVTGYTSPRQWDKYPSQRSKSIYLEGDQKYFIEALHKEAVGSDHVAVGWQLSDETFERPIPGLRLFPYGVKTSTGPPEVTVRSPLQGELFSAPATIKIEAGAHDEDGQVVKVEFFKGAQKLGTDISAPYVFSWKNVDVGNYSLTVKATDNSGATDTATVNVLVTAGQTCAEAGYIVREQWNKIPGTLISSIPVKNEPSFIETMSSFEAPSNTADHYGARIRGFLCVPVSGQYRFWISSNDRSELWLSTDSSPANRLKIADVPAYTDQRQWAKYASQQSRLINLVAGQKYYVEALHKEGVGTDHFAVGWALPDGTLERPIPGMRLLPYHNGDNQLPTVRIVTPANGETFGSPASITITAEADDADGHISKVEFYNGATKLGEDISAPYTFSWSNVSDGDFILKALATDNELGVAGSAPVAISVQNTCSASGTINREYWKGVFGNLVTDIPVTTQPDGVEALTLFESPQNAGTNYGARIRGYICPPQTGNYYFWISSNDHSELWVSTNDDPANKRKVAYITGATAPREWSKFRSQKSVAIPLKQGVSYYIEALHKQGVGSDHLAVGWQLPDGTLERPIAGASLSPVITAATPIAAAGVPSLLVQEVSPEEGVVGMQVYPNPATGEKLNIVLENLPQPESTIRQIEIRQLTGLPVFSERAECQGDCSTEINLNEALPSGVYILQVRIQGRTFTEKLVIP